jgi:hypothetical protein
MPAIECTKENFLNRGYIIDNLFEFYYCKIITPNDGSLLFPIDK